MRILQSFQAPTKHTNPYLVQLLTHLRATDHVAVFTWRTALTDSYDVFHIHWPEVLLRGNRWWKTAGRHGLYAALLARLAVTKTPLVRTVHNLTPHEKPAPITQLLLKITELLTTERILLNPTTPGPGTVVLHGHYTDWLAEHPHKKPVPGRILFCGLIRAYKNVPDLLTAFTQIPDDDYSLTICGKAEPAELGTQIAGLAAKDSRIQCALGHVPTAELVAAITSADIVVLPYREVHNSGIALMALSLHRRVLMAASPSALALQEEVGPEWVRTFAGRLSAEDLTRAVQSYAPVGSPNLTARAWPHGADQHRQVYQKATKVGRHVGAVTVE